MTAKKEGRCTIEMPFERTLQAAEKALTEIGARITDKSSNTISARRIATMLEAGYGEDIQISVTAIGNKVSEVKIISKTMYKLSIFDYGHNAKNINKITEKLNLARVNYAAEQAMSQEASPSFDGSGNRNQARAVGGSIFISYRRSDSADIAGRIYDRLIVKFGKNPVFKDVDSIPLGLDFKEYLDEQVGKCDVLLAIIGDQWVDASNTSGKRRLDDPTDFVRIEIESALERNIPVIPLLVRGASMPSEEKLPSSLQKLVFRNGIPIRPDPDFHRDMDRLIKALEEYVN